MSQPLSDFRLQSASENQQPGGGQPASGTINPYQSPDLVEVQESREPEPPKISPLESQIGVLLLQGRNGAKWLYWIAGFSIVNTLIMLISGGIYFVVGLAVTNITDQFAQAIAQQSPEAAVFAKVAAFAFSAFVSLAFCGFGWLALKRYQPLFFLGMVLYLLDGLLFLLLREFMAAAFHAYALYCMWSGFQAYRQLNSLEQQLMNPLHPMGEFNPHQLPTNMT
jgi:hypothetical protein